MRLPPETPETRLLHLTRQTLRMEWRLLRCAQIRGDQEFATEARLRIAACRERIRSDLAYLREDYRDAARHLDKFTGLDAAIKLMSAEACA